MNDHDHNLNHHDPETDALIERLNALGSLDRSAPDGDFEQRMMDSISKQIAPSPLPITPTSKPEIRMIPGWRFNIAASMLIVASASILVWSWSRTTPTLTPTNPFSQQSLVSLEEDFDALYELTNFADDLDADMADLELLTETIHTELALPSVLMELNDSPLEGSL